MTSDPPVPKVYGTDLSDLPNPRGGTHGPAPRWDWAAHRITGVVAFLFLVVHVLDTAMLRVSPDAYDHVAAVYQNPFVSLVEIAVVGAVLFHVLNGVRIIALDFWADDPRLLRPTLAVTVALWVAVMVPSAYLLGRHAFATWFGSAG